MTKTTMEKTATKKTAATKKDEAAAKRPAQHTVEEIENERLFGANVDFFLAMHRARTLARICRHAGVQGVQDNDIWQSKRSL